MNKHTVLSIFEIIELFSKRFPQVDFPEEFISFLHSQEANGHQIRRINSGETLVEFLHTQGITQNHFSSFLSLDSQLLSKIDYSVLLELSPEEVSTYILDHFSDVFYLQQLVLDSEIDTGFNRHGREHLTTVASRAVKLVRETTIVPAKRFTLDNEVILGALLHDIGNLISRKYHGLYGIYLCVQLFENFAVDEQTLESFLRFLEVILFHEVEYGSRLPTLALLHPSTLAVIVADKTDVSFKRVSSKSNVPEAIKDAHVLVNLLVANSTIQRIKGIEKSHFLWKIDFRPKFDTSQVSLFSRLLKATGRVKFPKEWQTVYEDANIEYLFLFNSTFLSIYLSRLYYAIRAVFALYPSVGEFQFVVDDSERGISLMRVFTPDDYQDKIYTLGKHLYRKEWPHTYIYKILERQSRPASESQDSPP